MRGGKSLSSVQVMPTSVFPQLPSDLPDQDPPISPLEETEVSEWSPPVHQVPSSALFARASQTSLSQKFNPHVSASLLDQPSNAETLDQLAANPNTEAAFKFKLKFKTALSSKGRPRKQLE